MMIASRALRDAGVTDAEARASMLACNWIQANGPVWQATIPERPGPFPRDDEPFTARAPSQRNAVRLVGSRDRTSRADQD